MNIAAIVSGAELLKTMSRLSKSGNSVLLVSMLTKSKAAKTVSEVRSADMRSQMKLTIAKARSPKTKYISQGIDLYKFKI
jgi:hypothetical protein